MARRIHVYCGRESNKLASDVCHALRIPRGKSKIKEFADLEPWFKISDIDQIGPDDIVAVINSGANPVIKSNFDLWGLLWPIKQRKPHRLIAVSPFYGFRRQERDVSGGEAVMSELMAQFMAAAGATDIVVCDIHHLKILEDFKTAGLNPYNLDPDPLFLDQFRGRKLTNWKVLRPDKGSEERATNFATALGLGLVKVDKYHPEHEQTLINGMNGDVRGCHILFRDDELATGGTVMGNADVAEQQGAIDMTIVAPHGVLSGNAVHKIADRPFIQAVYITDSIYLPWEKRDDDKIHVLSLAPMIANTLLNIAEED